MVSNRSTMEIFNRVKIEKGEASGSNDKGKAVILHGAFNERNKDGKYIYIGTIGGRDERAWVDRNGNIFKDRKGKQSKSLINWDEDMTLFRRETLGTLRFCVETTPSKHEIG